MNNAATSQYELSHAFGNRRPGSKSLYTGGLSAIIENSEFDARPYSLSGQETPKDLYDRITMGLTLGGPIKIPRLPAAWSELLCCVPVDTQQHCGD